MKSRVSVIMPNYNCEQYIEKAIESILGQTYFDFEFIIIDDCSIDESWNIILEYQKKDSRIRAFRNEKNRGISFTMNYGVSLANYDIIARMDSDDVAFKIRLEKQIVMMKEFDVVGSNIKFINSFGQELGTREYDFENISKRIKKESPLANPTVMFKKELIEKYGGYIEEIDVSEDYDMWLRWYSKGVKFGGINEVLMEYRQHNGQMKYVKTRRTLKQSVVVKIRAVILYNIKFSLSDWIRLLCEIILLMVPRKIMLILFYKTKMKK